MIPRSDIPDIMFQYWSITHMNIPMGMYGLDDRRAEYHEELCKYYGVNKEESKVITDNIDKYEWIGDFQNAFEKLVTVTKENKDEKRS